MARSTAAPSGRPGGWRLKLGFGLVLLSLFSPAFIPLVTATGLSAELKAAVSGLLVLGIPQVLMVLAVLVVGKPGFAYIKAQILGRFRRLAPPRAVGRGRYRIGLVMFCTPLLLAFLGPYLARLLPGAIEVGWELGLLGDGLFIASFFVLGGDFWDKLRALFIHGATARFPGAAPDA